MVSLSNLAGGGDGEPVAWEEVATRYRLALEKIISEHWTGRMCWQIAKEALEADGA